MPQIRKTRTLRWIAPLVLFAMTAAQGEAPFELKDGDRVAFLGDAFFERSIRYGHIETVLAARWPDRDIVFRNLGWAGDGPDGRARAFFDPIEQGFENMKGHIDLADPSVVFVSYGSMASFEGEAGLGPFLAKMNGLMNLLEERGARVVILSPTPREPTGEVLPDAETQNRNLARYTGALSELAKRRGAFFVDLFHSLEPRSESRSTKRITENGAHLNDYGYFQAAERLVQALGSYSTRKTLSLGKSGEVKEASGITLLDSVKTDSEWSLRLQDERLSLSPLSGDYRQNLTLALGKLPRGRYSLEYEGKVIATGSSQQWERGIQLAWEPSNDQATRLRETIKRKNQLFFYQWRPQNETYLRGFRKREQGQNAAELEMFEPYIEKEEVEIATLKKPQVYQLILKREKGGEG